MPSGIVSAGLYGIMQGEMILLTLKIIPMREKKVFGCCHRVEASINDTFPQDDAQSSWGWRQRCTNHQSSG